MRLRHYSEAESHHKILDGMGGDMGGVAGMLGQTMSHFNKVLDNKNGRAFCYMVGGMVGAIWLLYYMFFSS